MAEVRTTGGNTNIDYNLRVKLGFPDANINVDNNNKIELQENSILALICEAIELINLNFQRGGDEGKTGLNNVATQLKNKWYHY